jgi:hypothetical protein
LPNRFAVALCAPILITVLLSAPAGAATRTVCASGCAYTGLQAAIDAAAFGDTILLRAGQTFVGHYILRVKSGTGTIIIRSDASDSLLPGSTTRLVPADRPGGRVARSLLPRLVGRGGTYHSMPLLQTEPGAHGYVVRFVEFDGAAQLGYETLIQLGTSTTATPPYDITLDRVYVHGDRYRGQKRGITMNGRRLAVLNSYVADIKAVDVDSQAILGYNGAGPFTILNNYLEASGENVMFGGADPAVTNLVPADIAIRQNHLFKPLSWRNAILPRPASPRGVPGTGGALGAGTHYFRVAALMATANRTAVSPPSAEISAAVTAQGAVTISWTRVPGADKYRVYRGTASGRQSVYLETSATSFLYKGSNEIAGVPPTSGTKWTVKNIFELKNAIRVTVDGNILEHSWTAAQVGYAIVLTPRNGGKAPWTRVQDVTFTRNIVRHVAGVANILGYDNNATSGRTERITFRNNLFADVSATTYGTGGAKAIVAGGGAAYLVFDRNTFIHTNSTALAAYGAAMPGLVFSNNNLQHHRYGINGDGASPGNPTLARYFPEAVVRCNAFAGGPAAAYPTPNAFPTVDQWKASFVNFAAGDYRVSPGSVVATTGCNGLAPGADIVAINSTTAGITAGITLVEPAPTTNQAPIADASGPYATTAGSLISVDGSQSLDPDGSVLDYRWWWGDEILVRAADLPASAIRGSEWVRTNAGDAAGGAMLLNPDEGAAKRTAPLAAPSSYVEFSINAAAGVSYYLWMRLNATADSYANDSLSLQFDGAVDAQGNPIARIGTTSGLSMILEASRGSGVAGWGWTDAVYGGAAGPLRFAKSGLQKIRIQQREDGVAWDQLVLSSAAFVTSPGPTKRDTTFVDEDLGTATGVSAAHRYARTGLYPVLLVVTDAAGATGPDTTTVTVK